MPEIQKIRINDANNTVVHPETSADIVVRGNSNVAADLSALETAVENIAVYSMVKDAEAAEGYAATYHLTKDGVNEGVAINIPKDFMVKDVEVKTCVEDDNPIAGLKVGDKYIDFTINVEPEESGASSEKHVYLAVSDICDQTIKLKAGANIEITEESGESGEIETVISAPNAYTKLNLVAGVNTSIELVPQPDIDEHTLGVFHYENNNINDVTGEIGDSSTIFPDTTGCEFVSGLSKFGTYCRKFTEDNVWFTGNGEKLTAPYTIDWWMYFEPGSGYNGKIEGGAYPNTFTIKATEYPSNGITFTMGTTLYTNPMQSGTWAHIAIEGIGNMRHFYFNGKLICTQEHITTGLTAHAYTGLTIDELRFSNIDRYVAQDFTPFNVAYSHATPEPIYQINNMLDVTNKIENTATGDHSITISGTPSTRSYTLNVGSSTRVLGDRSVAIGDAADVSSSNSTAIGSFAHIGYHNNSIALGYNASVDGNSQGGNYTGSIAIGSLVDASAANAIQLGNLDPTVKVSNKTPNTFQVYNYPLLDGNTGKIFPERLPGTGADLNLVAGDNITITEESGESGEIETVISAPNVYTRTNLIAGDSISITRVQLPEIDANTLCVYHFENSRANAVTSGTPLGNAFDYAGGFSFVSGGKFGEYGVQLNQPSNRGPYCLVGNNTVSTGVGIGPYSWDCWAKLPNNASTYNQSLGLCYSYGGQMMSFNFTKNSTTNKAKVTVTDGYASSVLYTVEFALNDWHHFAYDRGNGTHYFYIDGELVATSTAEFKNIDTIYTKSNGNWYQRGLSYTGDNKLTVDEVRFSNIARWQGQRFTPFNREYVAAGGDPIYQINSTITYEVVQ